MNKILIGWLANAALCFTIAICLAITYRLMTPCVIMSILMWICLALASSCYGKY